MSKPLPKFKKGDLVMYKGELYHISCQHRFSGNEYTYSMYRGDDPTAIYRKIYPEGELTMVEPAEEEVYWTNERVNEIATGGKFILDLCVNIPHSDKQEDGSIRNYVEHHIPLKRDMNNWNNTLAWDLSTDNLQFALKHDKNARDYAEAYINGEVKDGVDVLPPWLLFPHYSVDAPQWTTRLGGKYVKKWLDYLERISSSEFVRYQKKFPVPMYMSGTDCLGMHSLSKFTCGCSEEEINTEKEDSAC